MLLKSAKVTKFKSITASGPVAIDQQVTVLVGQNESGKTAFLKALHKARPVEGSGGYNVTEDYPRTQLNAYQKRHDTTPDVATELTYSLTEDEVTQVNKQLGIDLISELSFTILHNYKNGLVIKLSIDEKPFVASLLGDAKLTTEVRLAVAKATSVRQLVDLLNAADLNAEEANFKEEIVKRFKPKDGWSGWNNWVEWYVYYYELKDHIPAFLYFDDYYLLPYKTNLKDLSQKATAAGSDLSKLTEEHQSVLGLLKMAGVALEDLTNAEGYEEIKARLEAISNQVSDTLFRYWQQNKSLEVEFDIRADPRDSAPFNQGDNLYIRIRNTRHRATLPFDQRSKGFRWFFSFLVWFGSIKEQLKEDRRLVLLLDEPGLSLHGLAQADLLRYIDDLTEEHQILYTTHSPFMVNSERLYQVRTVEDKDGVGTVITDNVSGANANTLFPLQAALGYSIAQNLFISPKNLLVEGPGDLVYLKHFSALLEKEGREGLRSDITIVPVGGLDKIATFIALLHGNELEFLVLHDFDKRPDPRIESLVRDKILRDKQVLHYAMFRDPKKYQKDGPYENTDVEDLISLPLYLKLFNATYNAELGTTPVAVDALPPRERVVESLNAFLKEKQIELRKGGGFNHYLVANHTAATPSLTKKPDAATLGRFELLFQHINMRF
ncbi:hypothetical protein D3875_02540 [Deinococcus cavernae]|uniref:Uncharacterized protein n=1 Tax=Deinococcus cavernae TaxID=2320857 RepID=A0A418VFR2_9DEIO|nr:AAA family ATPase [Deinococcus cavernae]RJF74891.1 hypothetical protein D3875_02540 [Deinococcus cavernae]